MPKSRNARDPQALVGQVIPATRPGGYLKAVPRLASVRGARRELAAAITAWKRGEIDSDGLRAVTYGLRTLAELVAIGDLEGRLTALERSDGGSGDGVDTDDDEAA